MAGYSAITIKGNEAGLIESRENFLLPNDAYPIIQNFYVWRERLKRKRAYQLLGRLQRNFTQLNRGFVNNGEGLLTISGFTTNITNAVNAVVTTAYPHGLVAPGTITFTNVQGMTQINGISISFIVLTTTTLQLSVNSTAFGVYTAGTEGFFWTNTSLFTYEPNAQLVPGSVRITYPGAGITYIDDGLGNLNTSPVDPSNTGKINYITGFFTLTATTVPNGTLYYVTLSYNPGLPVMGIRIKENQNSVNDKTIFWDTVYAYDFNSGLGTFEEFLPGTTWTGTNYEFFWTTNYWIDNAGLKIFWATNFSLSGDPIRYTNGSPGTNWIDFKPIINAAGDTLNQALIIVPFRGRLVVFNTRETDGSHTNRIRWAAIGNPFTVVSATNPPNNFVTVVNPNAWKDDIRGQGGFLDIPTSEDIVSVGFVRDNLVIYCDRSTWQLRYTGRTIAPFQIEKVNSELGATSTFSGIQFDTSLLGIGDKGIVECDSFKSQLIDIKIPDFVFNLNNNTNGPARIQGIRDFINRLAYWTYCSDNSPGPYPDGRLVYNYENDSWATFTDSLTALGTYQVSSSRTWLNTHEPWINCPFNWLDQPSSVPTIVGGNQQGFIEILDELNTNDPSLFISAITGSTTNPIVITSPDHNLRTGGVIKITGIPTGTPYATLLNGNIFGIVLGDNSSASTTDKFRIYTYNSSSDAFDTDVIASLGTYIGGGVISVRDNFNITSKKFNFIDDGQNIQMGYFDILTNSIANGAFSVNIYLDYQDNQPVNTVPQNEVLTPISDNLPDGFFNQIIPTSQSSLNTTGGTKFWQRIICPVRGNFITIQYLFSNAQMAGVEQTLDVQIDAQVLWVRRAGRMTQI